MLCSSAVRADSTPVRTFCSLLRRSRSCQLFVARLARGELSGLGMGWDGLTFCGLCSFSFCGDEGALLAD